MGKSVKSAMKYERTPVTKDNKRVARQLAIQSKRQDMVKLFDKGWFVWLVVFAVLFVSYWVAIKSIYIIVGGL